MVITAAGEQSSANQHAANRLYKQTASSSQQQQQHHIGHHRASCCGGLGTTTADIGEQLRRDRDAAATSCSLLGSTSSVAAVRQRRESQLWLARWAHIWTKRQSPEWKPRRASVATCQRLQSQQYHQQQTLQQQSRRQQQQQQPQNPSRKDSTHSLKYQFTDSIPLIASDSISDSRKKLASRLVWTEDDDGDDVLVDQENEAENSGVAALLEKTASNGSSLVDSSSGSSNNSSAKSSRSGSSSSQTSSNSAATDDDQILQQHQVQRRQVAQSCCCCSGGGGGGNIRDAGQPVSCLQRARRLTSEGEGDCAGTVHFAPVTSKQQARRPPAAAEAEEEVNRSSWCSLCGGGGAGKSEPTTTRTTASSSISSGDTTANSSSSSHSSSNWNCCCRSGSICGLAVAATADTISGCSSSGADNTKNSSSGASCNAKNKPTRGTSIAPEPEPETETATAPLTTTATSQVPHCRRGPTATNIDQSLQLQERQRKLLIRSMMRRMVSEDCLRSRRRSSNGLQQLFHQQQQQQFSNNNNNNNSMKSNNNNNKHQCSLKRRETTTACLPVDRPAAEENKSTTTTVIRQRRRGETNLKHLVNGISTSALHRALACPAAAAEGSRSSSSSSLSSNSSSNSQQQQQQQQPDEDDDEELNQVDEEEESSEDRLEAAIVESWLDDHPKFVRDYFVRKANYQLINDWLITNAKLNNLNSAAASGQHSNGFSQAAATTNSASNSNDAAAATTSVRRNRRVTSDGCRDELTAAAFEASPSPCQGNSAAFQQRLAAVAGEGRTRFKLDFDEQESSLHNNRHSSSAEAEAAAAAAAAKTGESCPRSHRSNSQSGGSRLSSPISMPVRKISATDFETRTGSGYLRPMVSRTPDGRPTFLSCCQLDLDLDLNQRRSVPAASNTVNPFDKQSEIERERKRSKQQVSSDDISVTVAAAAAEPAADEIELVFELVKNICNDLDIQTLLHKILRNIAVLINADKSSLFLVRDGANEASGAKQLVSQLFNVDQESDDEHADQEEPARARRHQDAAPTITIPWGTGLVGYVAASGESINIANCYEDPRFTDTIDQQTGYVTRNMLCAPIFDKRNEIVGVAQVINKRQGDRFSQADELKFNRYLQFCGIGLRNAQSYENCQLENKRNQVMLDLARIIFEEQSTIEQVVHKIILHTQSLLECERCQVLLIDDGSEDLEHLLQVAVPSSSSSPPPPPPPLPHLRLPSDSMSHTEPAKPKWRPHFRHNSDSGAGSHGSSPCESASESDCLAADVGRLQSTLAADSDLKQQDSSKLFSLVFDLECGGSGANDLVMHNNNNNISANNANKQSTAAAGERRKFPINLGITGYVAMTGETLNIEDAHKCELFDPSVDRENPDFKHKSILCMPIRNGKRQIIGVSQLINKRNGRPFNKNDEDLFEAFSIFFGLGIHNTLMYEKVLKIMAKQRVTFEVLSYHATAPLEEAKKLHAQQIPSSYALNLTSLQFNDFSLDEQFMLKSCLRFFLDLDLMRRFQIDQLVFCNWILSVQRNYRTVTYHPIVGGNGLKASPVRYHNWRHAFNVSQMMFAILINTQICRALGELETLALLIACLCHDLDHRGTNNSFQIKSASPLAELYSTSTMEHHHFDQCVMILNSQGNQILANLSPEEYSRVISLLEEAILATDLANYFQKRETFFQLVEQSQFRWKSNEQHRSLLRCMLMTACDVAAITKPWSIQKIVADLVMSEFYQQGDIEKNELHIEPIDLMNREKMSKLPEMQIGFIDTICAPIYTAFAKLFPLELKPLLDGCLSNRELWRELSHDAKQQQHDIVELSTDITAQHSSSSPSSLSVKQQQQQTKETAGKSNE